MDKGKTKEGYSGEVYFILPEASERTGLILQATVLLRILDNLNEQRKINELFLKRDEEYSVLEAYCMRKNIGVQKISDNAELLEEIIEFYGKAPRRFAYVTHSEDRESLGETISNLADWGFYIEIKNC